MSQSPEEETVAVTLHNVSPWVDVEGWNVLYALSGLLGVVWWALPTELVAAWAPAGGILVGAGAAVLAGCLLGPWRDASEYKGVLN